MGSLYDDDDYELSAAFDIGTTFSGYAYSFKGSEKDIKGCKDWGANLGVINHKAPTAVLVNKDGKFEAFGYEAQERYKHLGKDDADLYSLYERFKMELMPTKKPDCESKATATNGQDLPLMEIFTMTIQYLKDQLVKSVEHSHGQPLDPQKIRWVITVPAIWSNAAKQFMIKAAEKAIVGSISKPMQLIIALEPEVAGLYAASKNMTQFAQTSATFCAESNPLRADIEYVVVDCGGGIIDITSYKIEANMTLKQTYKATGNEFGGTKVDDAFVQFLNEVVGEDVVSAFKHESPVGWLQLMSTFDYKKKTITNKDSDKMNIEIPYSMYEIANDLTRKKLANIVNQREIPGVRCSSSTGKLVISHTIIQDLFKKSVQGIVDHMTQLMRLPELKNVSTILMVGGFSESKILQAAMKKIFGSKFNVLIPDDASLCVLYGAVAYGHNPDIIKSHIAHSCSDDNDYNSYCCTIF